MTLGVKFELLMAYLFYYIGSQLCIFLLKIINKPSKFEKKNFHLYSWWFWWLFVNKSNFILFLECLLWVWRTLTNKNSPPQWPLFSKSKLNFSPNLFFVCELFLCTWLFFVKMLLTYVPIFNGSHVTACCHHSDRFGCLWAKK